MGVGGLVDFRFLIFDFRLTLLRPVLCPLSSALCPLSSVFCPLVWIEYVKQRQRQIRLQDGGAAVDGGAENWVAFVEFAAHVDILRTLSGEEKGDLGGG